MMCVRDEVFYNGFVVKIEYERFTVVLSAFIFRLSHVGHVARNGPSVLTLD